MVKNVRKRDDFDSLNEIFSILNSYNLFNSSDLIGIYPTNNSFGPFDGIFLKRIPSLLTNK